MAIPIISDIVDNTIGKLVDKALSYIPDPVLKLQAAKEIRDAAIQIALAQIDVNKMEIGTGKLLGMWRAALGWSCVFALVWNFILYQFLVAFILLFKPTFPVEKIPVLDWSKLGGILMGMLGLG